MHSAHLIISMCLTELSRRGEPKLVRIPYVRGHIGARNNEVFKSRSRVGQGNTCQNPKEIRTEVLFGLQADTACSIARYKGFDLDVNKARTGSIAAEHVRIRRVAQRDNSSIASTT